MLCSYRFRSFRGTPKDWILRIRFKKFKVGVLVNATTCDGGYMQVRSLEETFSIATCNFSSSSSSSSVCFLFHLNSFRSPFVTFHLLNTFEDFNGVRWVEFPVDKFSWKTFFISCLPLDQHHSTLKRKLLLFFFTSIFLSSISHVKFYMILLLTVLLCARTQLLLTFVNNFYGWCTRVKCFLAFY